MYTSIIDHLAYDVGYRWQFVSDSPSLGSTSCCEKIIFIDTRCLLGTEDGFWSVVFHELTHAKCQREGIYPELHRQHPMLLGELDLLCIESLVDEMAEETMSIYFPPLKYMNTYDAVLAKALEEVKRFEKLNRSHK